MLPIVERSWQADIGPADKVLADQVDAHLCDSCFCVHIVALQTCQMFLDTRATAS